MSVLTHAAANELLHTHIREIVMTMEKRGVVETEHEKNANQEVKKKYGGTKTGRMPTDKPNQANTPKADKPKSEEE